MKFGVLLAAAGSGKRMGMPTKKQFISIGDVPVFIRSLQVFLRFSQIRETVIVTAEEDQDLTGKLLNTYFPDRQDITIVPGGSERQESVYRGLKAFKDIDSVLIHDGARPLLTPSLVERIMDGVEKHGAVIPAVPVKDTIKQVNRDGWVESTPERTSLWAVQTPQAFRLPVVLKAHEVALRNGWTATDDAMLLEKSREPVKIIEGEEENIKLTTPADLVLAEAILRRRSEQD
ncbi:MAG: 2-C-methyl-D-erythritol 4-phosphate cytidylyltransferase [Bacillaceae bacterium]|nr:2-C-methyl-D-erythritol 4-phosphate cytidylyltransferase [Bacillaceae bacterium]